MSDHFFGGGVYNPTTFQKVGGFSRKNPLLQKMPKKNPPIFWGVKIPKEIFEWEMNNRDWVASSFTPLNHYQSIWFTVPFRAVVITSRNTAVTTNIPKSPLNSLEKRGKTKQP